MSNASAAEQNRQTPSPPRGSLWRFAPLALIGALLLSLAIFAIELATGPQPKLNRAYGEARDLLMRGDYSGAAERIAGRPTPRARTLLAEQIGLAAGLDEPEVVAELERFRTAHPEDPVGALLQAELIWEEQPERAEQLLARATEQLPELAQAWYLRGLIARAGGDLDAALPLYGAALEQAPKHPLYLSETAQALATAGNFRAAAEAYQRIVKQAPRRLIDRLNAAEMLLLVDRPFNALNLLHPMPLALSDSRLMSQPENLAGWQLQGVPLDQVEQKREYVRLNLALATQLVGEGSEPVEITLSEDEAVRTAFARAVDRLRQVQPKWRDRMEMIAPSGS